MIAGTLRALTVTVLVATALSACDSQKRDPVAAAKVESASAADPGASKQGTCLDEDIECQERWYQLEETLFAYEAGIAKQIDEAARSCWTADIEAFRRVVDNCHNFACKEDALLKRIASLHWRQPEEQRASLDLPEAPLLISVLAPDAHSDRTSNIGDTKLQFEARGSLIRGAEHPEHMGIAVSTGEKNHVFIFDMDIGNQPGQDEVLGLVGTSPTTQVLVRGHALVAPTGVSNFDPSQCRWVYQLPSE